MNSSLGVSTFLTKRLKPEPMGSWSSAPHDLWDLEQVTRHSVSVSIKYRGVGLVPVLKILSPNEELYRESKGQFPTTSTIQLMRHTAVSAPQNPYHVVQKAAGGCQLRLFTRNGSCNVIVFIQVVQILKINQYKLMWPPGCQKHRERGRRERAAGSRACGCLRS